MVEDGDEGLEALVDAVVAVFPTYPRMKIEADLEVTGDPDETVNRILGGNFLEGTRLDPRRYSKGKEQETATESGSGQSTRPQRTSNGGRPSYTLSDDDDDMESSDEELVDPRFVLTQPAKSKPKSRTEPPKATKAAKKPATTASKSSASAPTLSVPARQDPVSGSSDVEIIEAPTGPKGPSAPNPSAVSAPAPIYSLDSDSDDGGLPFTAAAAPAKPAAKVASDSSYSSSPRPMHSRFTFDSLNSDDVAMPKRNAFMDSDDSASPQKKQKKAPARPRKKKDQSGESMDSASDREQPKPRKRAPKDPAKAAAQEAEKARKAAERERKKQEKEEKQKEDKIRKEELKRFRQVNRVMGKKEASKDMMVDIDVGVLNRVGFGALIENLRQQDCQVSMQSHPVADTILWRRRTRALWSTEEDRWVPLDAEQIIPENFVVSVFTGDEFAHKLGSDSITTHLAQLRSGFPKRGITFLITGLNDYRRRKKTTVSASFQDQVRQQAYGAAPAGPPRQPRGATIVIGGQVVSVNDLPSAAELEQELLRLQVVEKIKIIECTDAEEAIDFIIGLTTEIAMIPHKALRENILDFCPDGKSRKSGVDGSDTWQWMLRQIHSIEDHTSTAILQTYPTFSSLYEAYTRCATKSQAENLLQDIVIQRFSKNGETNRRLGPALSKRIYGIIMGEDPEENTR